jgi:hypothetical protein
MHFAKIQQILTVTYLPIRMSRAKALYPNSDGFLHSSRNHFAYKFLLGHDVKKEARTNFILVPNAVFPFYVNRKEIS